MDRQENRMVVHEVMQTFYEAVTRLLPEAWLRRWTEPEVDAEALIRSLADSVEDLWMHVDALVSRVQGQELSPEDEIAQAREHLIATIHQLLPTVEVRQRLWRSRKIGTLVELAAYQVTLDHLLAELRVILHRIARAPVVQESGWPTVPPTSVPELPASTPFWDGSRSHVSRPTIPSRWSTWPVAGAPTSWATAGASSDHALRHVRVTRRLLVNGQVVREDVAEAEVPLALNEEAAVAAVEAQLLPYLPQEMAPASEPASGVGRDSHGSMAAG